MSFYNKPYLLEKKKEIINQDNKCNYRLCLQNHCNDINCKEHNCYNFANIESPYGKYCERHFKLIKGYYKSEVFKRI